MMALNTVVLSSSVKPFHTGTPEYSAKVSTVLCEKPRYSMPSYISGVPVWNGLTDEDHPTQVLADFLTAKEVLKKDYAEFNSFGQTKWKFIPIMAAPCINAFATLLRPSPTYVKLNPTDELLNRCKNIAAENGGNILITDDIDQGVKGSDVIYT
jgi:ornithine carbamoyltransferase